jgi:ethanolamine permease
MPFGWSGVFAALPFAVWFYLAIEGVAMVAEEVKDPKRNIPRGYIYALGTLVFLAFGVMILTGGVTDWRKLSKLDYPLPEAISVVLGKGSGLTQLFASIGLFGLIASIHGTILASSRQVFAMARSGYLPRGLSGSEALTFKTPHWAIIVGGLISFVALFTRHHQPNPHPIGNGGGGDVHDEHDQPVQAPQKGTKFRAPLRGRILPGFPGHSTG